MATNSKRATKMDTSSALGFGGLEYYTLHDYKRLLLRRKWTIISLTLATALMVSVAVYFYPDYFTAKTMVQVDPGKVPESYVKSTATISAAERLALQQQQILSNTKLSQVVDELGLYANLRKTTTQDQVLLQMRKDIVVEPVTFNNPARDLEAFTISFTSRNPSTAAQVANKLASLFIEENLRSRQDQVMGTAEFFDRELEQAKRELAEKTQRMEALKARYYAELPESQNAHVQAIGSLQLELRAEMDAISQAQQQKVILQSLLADTPQVVDLDSVATSGGSSGLQEQLSRVQNDLDQLRSRYGPEYPDVVKKTAEIESLQKQIKQQEKSGASGAVSAPAPAPARHNPVIESQIEALDQDVKKHEGRETELKSQIEYYQSKLEGSPAVAQQMAVDTRDYQNAEDHYNHLQERKFSADISSDVETRQKGERFVVLEPAQPPARPSQPNRPLLDGLGLLAGLLISLFAVLVFEVMDTTIKTEREVTERLSVPIFGEIPWMVTQVGKRRSRLRTALATSGTTLLALGYLALVKLALR